MEDSFDNGISRRGFLKLTSRAALAPAALSLAPLAETAVAATSPAAAKQEVPLNLGFSWHPSADDGLSAYPITNPAKFNAGNPDLIGRPLRITLEGLFGADQLDLAEARIDITRPCHTTGCGVIDHHLWSFDQASSGLEFTYQPVAGEHLQLDIKAAGLIRRPGKLGMRILAGRTQARSALLHHQACLRLSLGRESGLAKLHSGVYFFGVPGLSHQADFAEHSCGKTNALACSGDPARRAAPSGLLVDNQLAYFMLSISDAA